MIRQTWHSIRVVAKRLAENRDVFEQLLAILRSVREEERDANIGALMLLIRRKQITSRVLRAPQSLVGFAKHLYEHEAISKQLRSIPHFGSLADLPTLKPEGEPLTRFDYALLQCGLLFDARMTWRGSGLNSNNGGIVFKKGKNQSDLSGLEVCQSWALLLSLGHLFGTFASERALFFQIDDDPNAKRDIINKIHNIELRKLCERIVDSHNLHHLYHVIAGWRIYGLLTGETKKTAEALLLAYLQTEISTPIERLRWMFRKTRQLSYNLLHSCVPSGVSSDFLFRADVERLLSLEGVVVDDYALEDDAVLKLMDSIDAYHAESAFASAQAASVVLDHVRKFKKWWEANASSTASERLEKLFDVPVDWEQARVDSLKHFCRLRLLGDGSNWLATVRAWLSSDSASNPWGSANFMISPSPRRQGLICDIYAPRDGLSRRTACHTIRMLAHQQFAQSWVVDPPGELERALWRSSGVAAARIFENCLADGFKIELEPVSTANSHFGMVIIASSFETGRARLKAFLQVIQDAERKRELEAVLELRSGEGRASPLAWLVFLARIRIVNVEGRRVADIDGLWADVADDSLTWTLVEVKEPGQTGGASQLRNQVLTKLAALPSKDVVNGMSAGQRVYRASVDTPEVLNRR